MANAKQNPDPEQKPLGEHAAPASFRTFLRSWRHFFLLLCLLLLVALFYAEEDWRGKREWNSYKARLSARGVPMEPAALVPKPVPPSENFASTPFLAPLFDFIPGTQRWRTTNGIGFAQNFAPGFTAAQAELKRAARLTSNSWAMAQTDLLAAYAAFQTSTNKSKSQGKPTAERPPGTELSAAQAADGVLAALAEAEPVIEELREASHRRYSRFDISYANDDPAAILLPHLSVLRRVGDVLQLRVSAELATGRINAAAYDVELLLYLAQSVRDEPIMVSQMVRMWQARQVIHCIAEGMGQWSDQQLRNFQERLQQFDFCVDMQRALDAERVFFGGGMIDFVHRNPEMYDALMGSGTGRDLTFPGALWAAAPSGWFDFEKRNYHVAFDQFRTPGIDLTNHLITPAAVDQIESSLTRLAQRSWPVLFFRHQVFSALLLPGFAGPLRKTAFAQAGIDIASIACAVERYRLAHGQTPETLELLTQAQPVTAGGGNGSSPAPLISVLRRDIVNGEPLKYRREPDGRYLIYSVGWNAKDDGGTNVLTKGEGERGGIPLQGDWVWRPF
jgi:hypothetical protein